MAGPTYTYYPTVPQPATPFNETQAQILSNFQAMYELFAVNHVNFNIPDNYGKHNFTTMQFQTDDPAGQENEIVMYTKATTGSNPAEIFIRYPNNTSDEIVQLSVPSSTSVGTGTSGGDSSQGWCSFPSGIMIRWGSFSTTTGYSVKVTYSNGPHYKISSKNYQYGCKLSPADTPMLLAFTSGGLKDFTLDNRTVGNSSYNYLTMGQ